MGTVPAVLEAARRAELDIIAITDHDELRGALQGRDLAPRYGIGVVPGVEITTSEGHLLAYWIERPVPASRPLIEILLRVGEQGGLCVAPHPTAQWVPSLGAAAIWRALRHPDAARILVGIEIYNLGLPRLVNNRGAQALGRETGLAQLANTDSHMLWTIGLCASEFPGTSPQALRHALEQRLTRPVIGQRPAVFMASWLAQWSVRLAGCDVAAGVAAYARHHLPASVALDVADIYHLPMASRSCDLVLCSEVLEHLEDVQAALAELQRVSREHVLVTVPHEPFFRALARLAVWLRLGPDPGHVQFWTAPGFRRLMRQHLREVTFAYSSQYQLALAWGRY